MKQDSSCSIVPDISPEADLLCLAFYLPQFYPTAENDEWWEPGFTEWTNLGSARPLIKGHKVRRPIPPLGEYSLLNTDTMEAQYELARQHGIDGFLVWDYWLGNGRVLLGEPIRRALENKLTFRYALAWANHPWIDKLRGRILANQEYPGRADYTAYFNKCLPHFISDQYIKVSGQPLFFIYRPEDLPDANVFIETWQELASKNGLPPIFFAGDMLKRRSPAPESLNAYSNAAGFWSIRRRFLIEYTREKLRKKLFRQTLPQRFEYSSLSHDYMPREPSDKYVPTVMTGWDTTPRHGRNGVILKGLTRAAFRNHLEDSSRHLLRTGASQRLLFIKSWNEWAEGNILEPDSVHGTELLETFANFSNTLREKLRVR